MKIEEISINDYGPIKNFTCTLENFECIFGLNESGKTAIVEALSYVLFKRSSAGLRYGKPENINIKIEEAGEVHPLPAEKMQIELPPADIAHLLYVRASESSIYGPNKEERFWDGLKTMFSNVGEGMTFTKLDSKIFETVGLQPKEANWKKDNQYRIQIEKQRLEDLEKYINKIGEIEKKELELSHLIDKHDSLKKDLKTIEDYKNYKIYKEASSLYSNYIQEKTRLQEFERYKYDYLTKWKELEIKKISRMETEKQLKEIRGEIAELERDVMDLKRKEGIIETEGFKTNVAKTHEEAKEPPIIYPALTLSTATIILILSFFTTIPKIPAFVIFVISLAWLIFFLYKRSITRKNLVEKNKWLKKAKKLFPDISNLAELADKIEAMEKMEIEKVTLLNEKKKIKKRLSKEETVERIEKDISDLRNKTGLAECADLKEKLNEKSKIETELNKLHGKIHGMLSEKNDMKWEKIIKDKKTAPPEKEPDLIEENELRKKFKTTQEKVNDLKQEIKVFKEIQQTKFNIVDNRSAFIEYNSLQKRLENYELEKKAALVARDILSKMSSELDDYIQFIIKGNESLSEYFKLVTERYDEVEVKNKNFTVKQKDGKKYKIGHLSSGTRDQLLLCFRMAALKRIYPQGGFLILDDAFIFADWHRRKKLVTLLKKFIEGGNQVIYLTSDDHTRDLFKDSGAKVTTI